MQDTASTLVREAASQDSSAGIRTGHEYARAVGPGFRKQVGLDGVGQAVKLDPHPQVLVALGLLKTNPRPMISSRKSMVVPLR